MRAMTWTTGSLALAACLIGAGVFAQSPTTAPAPQPAACTAAEYRQFDFWLGPWTVSGGPDGRTPQGTSRIERSNNGCWIQEHWHGVRGSEGTSLNAWDAQYRVWRQFWTGGDGTVLRLQGGVQGGAMVMEGELPKAGGGTQRQRIRWTPQPDGGVRQLWQTSDDDGHSWQTSFDGIYRRVAPPAG
jgi:hypothetical protein